MEAAEIIFYLLVIIVGIFMITKNVRSIKKNKKKQNKFNPAPKPAPKAAPKAAAPVRPKTTPPANTPKPVPPKPIVSDDPTWLSVTNVPGFVEKTNMPIYLNVLERVVMLIQQNVPDHMVIFYQRPAGKGSVTPEAIEKLPRHGKYIPGQTVGVISAQGKLYCIDLLPYTITDQTRKNFCKLLAQRLGCGCQLFTAQLPNTKGTQVERVLGCILSQHVNLENGATTQVLDEQDSNGGVVPIPIAVTSFEWEEIDEDE